eukprot:6490204-Amphidinium_carterae.2
MFHGSFAPFHKGHYACIKAALDLLLPLLPIAQVIVACTLAEQLERKHLDSFFASVKLRTDIIKAVLEDSDQLDVPIIVSERAYKT